MMELSPVPFFHHSSIFHVRVCDCVYFLFRLLSFSNHSDSNCSLVLTSFSSSSSSLPLHHISAIMQQLLILLQCYGSLIPSVGPSSLTSASSSTNFSPNLSDAFAIAASTRLNSRGGNLPLSRRSLEGMSVMASGPATRVPSPSNLPLPPRSPQRQTQGQTWAQLELIQAQHALAQAQAKTFGSAGGSVI